MVFSHASELAVSVVDDKTPVLGLYVSLVLETFTAEIEPLVALVNVRYRVAFVEVSSLTVTPPETAAHANAEPFQLRYVLETVGATTNAEVPAAVL